MTKTGSMIMSKDREVAQYDLSNSAYETIKPTKYFNKNHIHTIHLERKVQIIPTEKEQ